MRPYQGPPGELWLAPRPSSLTRLLASLLLAAMVAWEALTMAAIAALLGAVLASCTGAGSSCTDNDGCPTGMFCTEHGRCEPPPPEDEPAMSWAEEQHAA